MDAEPVFIEAHIGWRDELWDATPRIQAGAEVGWGGWGLELNGGTRIAAGDYSGHLAAQELQQNDGSWFAMRDDLVTGGALVVWRPWWQARFGPAVALGGELASTQTLGFYGNEQDPMEGRLGPIPTAWVMARVGVEARVGRVGARVTFGNRMSWLARPGQYGPEEPTLAQVWRIGVDLLVRVR